MPPKRKIAPKIVEEEETNDIFGDVVFNIHRTSKTKVALKKEIEKFGGSVATTITKKVTHVITTQEDVDEPDSKVQKAIDHGLKIVSEDFIAESIKKGKKLDASKYELKAKSKGEKGKAKQKEEKPATRGGRVTKKAKTADVLDGANFAKFPKEIMLSIFEKVDAEDLIFNARRVCKDWNNFIMKDGKDQLAKSFVGKVKHWNDDYNRIYSKKNENSTFRLFFQKSHRWKVL